MFVSNKKKEAKNQETPLDVYYNALEEAYGNLPVPSDDWAGIEQLLAKYYFPHFGNQDDANRKAQIDIDDLTNAVDVIHEHYELIAKILGKIQRY